MSRFSGPDQTPDFIVPDEFAPKVVIEAKVAQDDGTARDKVTRVRHLGELSQRGQRPGSFKYEVVACIDGRGCEDLKKLLWRPGAGVHAEKSRPAGGMH